MMAVQQQPEAYLVGDPKWSMGSGAAARTRVVNHYRRCGDPTGPGRSPWLLAWLPPRCRLNERRGLGTSPILDRFEDHLAARLHELHRADARRCQPHTRPGVAAPGTDWWSCYGRIGLWRAEEGGSKRSRTPDPGGHGGGAGGGVWRVCGGVPRGFKPYALRQSARI